MKWTSWAFLAFIGSLCFFVLFIADQQMNAGVDRLSRMKIPPQSALDADDLPLDHDGPSGAKTHFVSFGTPHTHFQKK